MSIDKRICGDSKIITITADSFVNSHTRGDGNIQADILNLSLAGDFGYDYEF